MGSVPTLHPTHSREGNLYCQRWVGWYEAIEDLIPTLPEGKFAPWQLRRLPEKFTESFLTQVAGENSSVLMADEPAATITATHSAAKYRAYLVEGDAAGKRCPTILDQQEPAFTIKSAAGGRVHRAFIVDCQNGGACIPNQERGLTIRDASDPMFTVTANKNKQTVRAWLVDGDNAAKCGGIVYSAERPATTVTQQSRPLGWLETGRVVTMTLRCLARFQSFPDTYLLPEKRRLAATIIGNAVPPLLAQRVIESFGGR